MPPKVKVTKESIISAADVAFMALDVFLLVMFGTALSGVINFFLSTQGQISAVGSIVSSCYGFICGAYVIMNMVSLKRARAKKYIARNAGQNGLDISGFLWYNSGVVNSRACAD